MSDTTRRSILRSAAAATTGLATVAGTASATDSAAQTIDLYDDFTWGLYGWEKGKDLKEGVKGTIQHSTEKTASGWWNGCVKTTIQGYEDDGTVWLQTPVDVEPYTTYDVEISVSGYNYMDSFQVLTNTHATLDSEPIQNEDDIRNMDGEDNVVHLKGDLRSAEKQWKTYTQTGTYESRDNATAYFAFGTNLIYELDQTDYLDDVSLRMVPR